MGISGTQIAPTRALFGVMRFGAFRFGDYRPVGLVQINGTARSSSTIKTSIAIEDIIDEQPNTMALRVRSDGSWTPLRGQSIVVYLGTSNGTKLFAGRILQATALARAKTARFVRYQLECVDHTWELDHKRPTPQKWTATSVSTIASNIVTTNAPAFSTAAIEAGLGAVDFEISLSESNSEALTRLMKLVGGYWYPDYDKIIHAFVTPEVSGNPTTLDNTQTNYWGLQVHYDISQIRTRVHVIGGGAKTTAAVVAGATSIPVEDTSWYLGGGGLVLAGPQKITYTGRSVASGPGNLTGVPGSGAGSVQYAITQGETIHVLVTRNNTGAQTNLATILGGGHDGIIEHTISDDRLSATSAAFVGDGELALNAAEATRLTYLTRDKFAKAGKTIAVSVTTPYVLSGTFVIQQVTIAQIERSPDIHPVRTVEAGVSKRDLFDLLRQLG